MNKIIKDIINSIFPRRCPICDQIASPKGFLICRDCLSKLDFVKQPVCLKCGKEVMSDNIEYCYDCTMRPKSYEYGIALINYDDTAKQSMVKIKYKNKREYIEPYARLIAMKYNDKILKMHADCLIPVPAHPSRQKIRGYNQAQLLAQYIGRQLNIPVELKLLIRNKKTVPQKKLTADDRLNNLRQAFEVTNSCQNIDSVILIDDIYTTGATIEACTKVLKDAGVKKVYYISICIGTGI